MMRNLLFVVLILVAGCGTVQRPTIDSVSDGIAVTSADIETIAQTVQSLCRNVVSGGPCMSGALISTRTKDRFKVKLSTALMSLDTVSQLLAVTEAFKISLQIQAIKEERVLTPAELRQISDKLYNVESELIAVKPLVAGLQSELTTLQGE